MSKKLRESKAWRILAEEFDLGRAQSPWLCCAINRPSYASTPNKAIADIPVAVREAMKSRIREALDYAGDPAYGWTTRDDDDGVGGQNHQARVLACLMFAEQAKDEERASKAGAK